MGICFLRPPMYPHVLFAVHAVDDRAGAQEEEGLEEGVGHEVEDGGDEGAHAAGQEHIANWLTVGVGQDAV